MAFACTLVTLTYTQEAQLNFHQAAAFLIASDGMSGGEEVCAAHVCGMGFDFVEELAEIYEDYTLSNIYLRATLPGMPPTIYKRLVGQRKTYSDEWLGQELTLDEEALHTTCSMSFPVRLWKMRDASQKPESLANPCHPLHLAMHYKWKTDPDAQVTYDCGFGSASFDISYEGADLPAFSPVLTLKRTPYFPVSGFAVSITGAKLLDRSISFDGYQASGNGCAAAGDGDGMWLEVVNWAQVPLSPPTSFTAGVYAPVIVDFDLHGQDWSASKALRFRIPRNTPDSGGRTFDVVAAPFHEEREYWAKTWGGPWLRPFDLALSLDPDWMTEEDENVDPPDLACTFEESDLTVEADYEWPHFKARRTPGLSVQVPPDAPSIPSPWVPQSGLTVEQVGKTTRATVHPGATAGSLVRTLREDYFRAYLTPDGLGTYGLPGAYRYLKHQPGSDIWNWENYQFVRLEYESERPAVLALTVDYSAVTVHDNHLTGQVRVDEFSVDRERLQVSYLLPIRATEPPEVAQLVIDLGVPDDLKLQHVDALTLSGFVNPHASADPWLFRLHELEIRRYNPITDYGVGHTACTVTFNRPGEAEGELGLPLSYTGFTATAEGGRCCRPPDQIRTRCDEEGLDFVEQLTGSGSGLCLDFMRPLPQWYTELARQEGWEVDNQGQALPGHAAYDGAFVDGEQNDMLGGTLYTGDVAEVLDRPVVAGVDPENWTALLVRPRVGRLHLPAGYSMPCQVRKIIHGGLHGRVGVDGFRAGPGMGVALWEITPSGGRPNRLIETVSTDDWGHFASTRGCRELQDPPRDFAAAVATSPSGLSASAPVINTLRRWFEAIGVEDGLDTARISDGDRLTLVYGSQGNIVRQITHDAGANWTDPELLVEGAGMPAAVHLLADGDRLWLLFQQESRLKLREPDGTTSTLFPGLRSPAAFLLARGEVGRVGVLAYAQGAAWFLPLCWDGATLQPELAHLTYVGPALPQGADGAMMPDGTLYAVLADPREGPRLYCSRDLGRTWGQTGVLTGLPAEATNLSLLPSIEGELGRLGLLYLHPAEAQGPPHAWYTSLAEVPGLGWIADPQVPVVDLGLAASTTGDLKDLINGTVLAFFKDPAQAVVLLKSTDQGRSFG